MRRRDEAAATELDKMLSRSNFGLGPFHSKACRSMTEFDPNAALASTWQQGSVGTQARKVIGAGTRKEEANDA